MQKIKTAKMETANLFGETFLALHGREEIDSINNLALTSRAESKFLIDDEPAAKLSGESSVSTVVAINVSGGKDSDAIAFELHKYLQATDFR